MLYKNTVTDECWHLLQELMSLDFLNSFRLVGGTALSLQEGHRLSDDIDLFCDHDFNNITLEKQLKTYYSPNQLGYIKPVSFGIFCYIRDIKVDLMYWGDEFMNAAIEEDNIRMGDQEEILAMKLQAISSRASKKDFFDTAILFKKFSLEQGLAFYEKKYPYHDPVGVIKNFTNFENAEKEPDPVLLNSPSWVEVKQIIVNQFDTYFSKLY